MQICFERTNILRWKEGKDVAINLHQKRTLKRTVAKQEYNQLLTVQQKESIQQSRKGANVRNSYRKYTPSQHRISLVARSTAGY